MYMKIREIYSLVNPHKKMYFDRVATVTDKISYCGPTPICTKYVNSTRLLQRLFNVETVDDTGAILRL